MRATNICVPPIYIRFNVRVFSGQQSVCQCCAHAPARLLNTCRLQPTNLTRFLDQKLNELNKLTIEVGGKLSLEYNYVQPWFDFDKTRSGLIQSQRCPSQTHTKHSYSNWKIVIFKSLLFFMF